MCARDALQQPTTAAQYRISHYTHHGNIKSTLYVLNLVIHDPFLQRYPAGTWFSCYQLNSVAISAAAAEELHVFAICMPSLLTLLRV